MTKIWKKPLRFAMGAIAVLSALPMLGPHPGSFAGVARAAPVSDWRTSTSGNGVEIIGLPAAAGRLSKPIILAACGKRGLSMGIYFGVPMANSHYRTKTSLITVDLRIDNGAVIPLVFSPSRNWTLARVLDPTSSVGDAVDSAGVTIDNLIFNALGMKKRAPRADWSARRLLRTMAFSRTLSLRGTTRSGFTVTAQYTLEKLRSIHARLPSQCK